MTQLPSYKHWHLRHDVQGILWLTLDRADSQTNSLNHVVMEEFNEILDGLSDASLSGLVIHSAKKNGFIAGMDIQEFSRVKDANQAVELARVAQKLLDKLASQPMPTIALIHGFCLGGGLELALACDYRIAADEENTRLGLPEVMLGIHPGWGGTVRLPRLIGVTAAMDLMLTGRSVSAKTAKKLGLVDAAVPERQLNNAVHYFIKNKPAHRKPAYWQQCLASVFLRPVIGTVLRKKLRAKVDPEQYPAPYAMVEAWLENGAKGEKAFVAEAHSIGKLWGTETAKNLVRVYRLQERLKKLSGKQHFLGKRVHVIGAGIMGGDIAIWCALKGFQVTLQDRSIQQIAPVMKRAHALFTQKLKDPLLIRNAMDRLRPDPNGEGISLADVLIEAIYEDLLAKQSLFVALEEQAKPSAILATNTSSLLLEQINQKMQQPDRLIGIHFFNPVAQLPLVEVVHTETTPAELAQQGLAFVHQLGKLPLPVKSSPGFLVNRVLSAYLLEAGLLAKEGVPLAAIDRAAVKFGMPMGPIELMDIIGLDIILSAAKYLSRGQSLELLEELQNKVDAKNLGKKTGQGFYCYKNGHAQKPALPKNYHPPRDLTSRLIICLVNEAMACFHEKIVEDKDLVDAGVIFGTGFAPFLGGPLHYLEQLKASQETFHSSSIELPLSDVIE